MYIILQIIKYEYLSYKKSESQHTNNRVLLRDYSTKDKKIGVYENKT